ncbi:hypothetical protein DPMN_101334 [Dreissena polymorpha]|uniref:Uncharacterized protein n=1 Tax=Dreissena polymorpha TaxID=45954 RepID=A0A9D4LJ90_DREPO|nr:hypothetical protein DPMN_101334 [Dreissena polymorpha]
MVDVTGALSGPSGCVHRYQESTYIVNKSSCVSHILFCSPSKIAWDAFHQGLVFWRLLKELYSGETAKVAGI